MRSIADKAIEAGDKKCLRKDVGYVFRAASYHKIGRKFGIVTKQGGGFTTYQFGDGSKMRVGNAGAEEIYDAK